MLVVIWKELKNKVNKKKGRTHVDWEKEMAAGPQAGPGLNYAGVAHQSPACPMAATSFLLIDII